MRGIGFLLALLTTFSIYANTAGEERLQKAIENPEYMLQHWVELPSSSKAHGKKKIFLSIREAILLALRYNPNIKNAELDRIIQRYDLRLAQNEFELQYALGATALIQNTHYSGVGNATNQSYLATPEIDLKTKSGAEVALSMNNDVAPIGNYNPLIELAVKQPLLRGFGSKINKVGLLNAEDNDWLNKINLKQAVINQITQVIIAYRSLVLNVNQLENQRLQLQEARKTFDINEKKIKAGQLEPTANIQQSYQIESLSLIVEQGENDFNVAAQELLQLIGLDPDLNLSVPNDIKLTQMKIPSLKKAIEQGLNHNAEYLALKMQLRIDQRAYDVAKNQQLWQLDANANVQFGTINNVDSPSRGFSDIYNGRNVTEAAGLTLTVPLHDLSRRSQLINAKVKLEKDRLNVVAAKRALITLIKNTITSIKSQAKRYELAQRQVSLAAKSYDLEKRKQVAGIASSLDVNHTQNQLLQAQMGLINAKIAYLNQIATLQKILGTTLEDWNIKLRYTG